MSVQASAAHLLTLVESLEPMVSQNAFHTPTQALYLAATSIIDWSKTVEMESLDPHTNGMFQQLMTTSSNGLTGSDKDAKVALRSLWTHTIVFKAALKKHARQSKA
jgi:hypothetical protein